MGSRKKEEIKKGTGHVFPKFSLCPDLCADLWNWPTNNGQEINWKFGKITSTIIAKNSYSQVFVQNATNNQMYLRNTVVKEVMITVVPLLILNVNIHELPFGYLWTSFSLRVSIKLSVFQWNHLISRFFCVVTLLGSLNNHNDDGNIGLISSY